MKLKYRIVKKTYPNKAVRYFPQWTHWFVLNLIWFDLVFSGVSTYNRAVEIIEEDLNSRGTETEVISHHG